MSSVSFYKWRAKYGGMDLSLMTRMKEMEKGNARVKRMYADVLLRHDVLQEALEKSGKAKSIIEFNMAITNLLMNLAILTI